MEYSYLQPEHIRSFIKAALNEDIGDGDHTSLGSIPADATSKAQLIIKDHGMIAGLEMAKYIFDEVDSALKVEFFKQDGDFVEHNEIGFVVEGNAQKILTAERLVLNCLQRMSAIATYTDHLTGLIRGTNARLLDTRKTTPNFRLPEKWAVAIGGGVNHRFGLFDMVLIKDNHVDFAGGVRQAIEKTSAYLASNNLNLKVEVEVRSIAELQEALATGRVHRVLLDNMLPSTIRQALAIIDGGVESEASGGITEKNIQEIAETGVDFISVGALTHSYRSLDMSLKAI